MSEWQTMETAPKNGLSIIVTDFESGEFVMHWNPELVNGLVRNTPGIWQAADGSFTWDEQRGYGPTHWRELPQ